MAWLREKLEQSKPCLLVAVVSSCMPGVAADHQELRLPLNGLGTPAGRVLPFLVVLM